MNRVELVGVGSPEQFGAVVATTVANNMILSASVLDLPSEALRLRLDHGLPVYVGCQVLDGF